MPEPAQLEVRTIRGREVRLRWRPATNGEWLAWSYLPGPGGLPNEGVGFDARAASAEEAREAVIAQIESYLARQSP